MALFSLQELDIAEDPYILLIKNRIMEKARGLMEELEQDLNHYLKTTPHHLPEEINLKHGKISKGENYKYLPYVILDYPAFFTRKDSFAFRTMFYWGHFISFTLHLQGHYARKYWQVLVDHLKVVDQEEEVYFCVNDSPWEYVFDKENYRLLNSLKSEKIDSHIKNNDFMKISIKLSISENHRSSDVMLKYFKNILMGLAKNNS